MLDKAGDALVSGMGLKPQHVKLLIRVGWVMLVSTHIAWVCGWLVYFGLSTPFARASDVDELKATATLSLQIQLQQELRTYKAAWCSGTTESDKVVFMRKIDELRANLRKIAKIEDGVGEPQCR